MKKMIGAVWVVLCCLLWGCAPVADYPAQIGGSTFEQAPECVISLLPAGTAAMAELGWSDALAAVGKGCGYTPYTEELPVVGTQRQPDLEQIRSLKPDVILISEGQIHAGLAQLEEEGVQLISLPALDSWESLSSCYMQIGQMMGGMNTGKQSAKAYEDQMRQTLAEAGAEVSGKTFIYLLTNEGNVAAGTSVESEFLSACGLVNLAGDTQYTLDAEEIAGLAPDLILVDSGVNVEALRADEAWSKVSAFQEQVYVLPDEAFARGRLAAMEEALTELINQI